MRSGIIVTAFTSVIHTIQPTKPTCSVSCLLVEAFVSIYVTANAITHCLQPDLDVCAQAPFP
jgi:hypothetical protein